MKIFYCGQMILYGRNKRSRGYAKFFFLLLALRNAVAIISWTAAPLNSLCLKTEREKQSERHNIIRISFYFLRFSELDHTMPDFSPRVFVRSTHIRDSLIKLREFLNFAIPESPIVKLGFLLCWYQRL